MSRTGTDPRTHVTGLLRGDITAYIDGVVSISETEARAVGTKFHASSHHGRQVTLHWDGAKWIEVW